MTCASEIEKRLGPNAYWGDLTTKAFDSFSPDRTIAILPVGAIEQHGPHLPLNTDAEICHGLIERVLRITSGDFQAIALPLTQIGASTEHQDFPGTLSLTGQQLMSLWITLGKQICDAGIRKILILNTHGGQPGIVDLVTQELRSKHKALAVGVNSFRLGVPKGLFSKDELECGIHGGEIETSIMLHLKPEKVHMERSENFKLISPIAGNSNKHLSFRGVARFAWQAQDLNPKGVVGNASSADPARGAALVQHMVDSLAEILHEMAQFPLSQLNDAL